MLLGIIILTPRSFTVTIDSDVRQIMRGLQRANNWIRFADRMHMTVQQSAISQEKKITLRDMYRADAHPNHLFPGTISGVKSATRFLPTFYMNEAYTLLSSHRSFSRGSLETAELLIANAKRVSDAARYIKPILEGFREQ